MITDLMAVRDTVDGVLTGNAELSDLTDVLDIVNGLIEAEQVQDLENTAEVESDDIPF